MREPRPSAAGMTGEQIVDALNDLIELDRNAIGGYDSAIKGLEDFPEIEQAFVGFRGDHERHIRELSPFVRQHGGTPESTPGPMGMATKVWTELTRISGGSAIVRAMIAAERNAVDTYEDGLRHPWPAEIREVVERGAADERRHLAYCEETHRRLEALGK